MNEKQLILSCLGGEAEAYREMADIYKTKAMGRCSIYVKKVYISSAWRTKKDNSNQYEFPSDAVIY